MERHGAAFGKRVSWLVFTLSETSSETVFYYMRHTQKIVGGGVIALLLFFVGSILAPTSSVSSILHGEASFASPTAASILAPFVLVTHPATTTLPVTTATPPVATSTPPSSTPSVTLAPPAATTTSTTTTAKTVPVVRVVDGDTVVVSINSKNTTLRLIGLDTPETVDPRKKVQCFGKEASDEAKQILTGKTVRVEGDASQGVLDKYGRTLAYVYLPDGTLFNKFMIQEGYGHEYTYKTPYEFQKQFKAAEVSAREGEKGLWASDACAK